jgi:hypothetical protein
MTELATALAKAQAAMGGAKKDSTNPHFKNKYADLASVWDACRKALTDNGLSVVQFTETNYGEGCALVTMLLHSSGQSIKGSLPLPQGKNMQELGSALTYARRYGLAAMVGVAPEDDDGNAAVATERPVVEAKPKPAGYDDWRLDIRAAAENGLDALRDAWKASTPEYRTFAGAPFLDELKGIAGQVAVPA